MDNSADRQTLLNQLTNFLEIITVDMKEPEAISRKSMKSTAHTREDRHKLLEKFFREIFTKVIIHIVFVIDLFLIVLFVSCERSLCQMCPWM